MKNYGLKPTDENLLESLTKDSIKRNKSIFRFIELLNSVNECCTVAINGDWGSGKTFFIRQVKLILDAQNPNATMHEKTRYTINDLLPLEIKNTEIHSTVYYDSWIFDNHDDPILSLMYATISSKQSDFSVVKQRSLLDSLASIAEALTGRNITEVSKNLHGQDIFSTLKNADDIRQLVRAFIDALIEERGNRLIFFIDELDRCKPDYTIRFLERIKHYFDDDRITFVFSVNLTQLQYTVKNYYGLEFSATRYLDKFFDLRMSLPGIDHEHFLLQQLNFYNNSRLNEVCIATVKYFNLSLRETERYVRLMNIATQSAALRLQCGFDSENAQVFSLTYFVPIILGLQMTDMNAYLNFISGTDIGPLIDILENLDTHSLTNLILYPGEYYNEKTGLITLTTDNRISESIYSDRLQTIYNAAFPKSGTYDNRGILVGKMRFSSQTKYFVEEIASLLSPLSNYKDS